MESWPTDPTIRVAADMHNRLAAWPEGSPAYADRFKRILDGTPADRRDALLDDLAVIRDEMQRIQTEGR